MKRASFLVIALYSALASAEPVSVYVPNHQVWCVSSQPITLEPDTGGTRFGDLVFYELYQRLERAALKAALPSIGIPFLESVHQLPVPIPPSTAPAPAATPSAQPKFVMRVCSNVPGDTGAPSLDLRVEPMVLAATTIYGILCNADDVEACNQELRQKVRIDKDLTEDEAAELEFSVSQSLDGRPDGPSLLKSLIDYSARPLKEGNPLPNLPRDKLILWVAP